MIELQPHELGVLLPVRAQAGAKQNAVKGERAGALVVAVTQAPEKGKANKALAEVIAAALGLKKSQVEIFSGETNPQKKFLVRDVSLSALAERLDDILL